MISKVSDSYKKNIGKIIFGPFLKIIEAIFDLLIPLIMKAVIDMNQYQDSEIPNALSAWMASMIKAINPSTTPLSNAITGGIIILVMGIVGYIITMISQYIAACTAVNVGGDVRGALYAKILSLSKKEREIVGNSKLLTTINSDSYQLQHGVLLFVRLMVRAPVILLGSLVFSFILDWRVGIAFIVIVPLILLLNIFVLSKSSKGYIAIQSDLDDISNNVSETLDGYKVIRASNQKDSENNKNEIKTKSYMNRSIKVNRLNALLNPLTFAISSIVVIVIVLLLQDDLFGPDNILIASMIIAEMAYLSQIFFTTVQLSMTAVDMVKATVARKRINSVLQIEPAIKNIDKPISSIDESAPIIKFDHVSFSFLDNESYFLNDLDFEIRKGETFGIIGGTGSGKTTVINLIERFYDATKGTILYKGVPLKEYDLNLLRNDIGLVNQKSSLFLGSIKSNYLMSKADASDEDVINALKQAEAYEFVNKYEDGINHEVKEGGVNFSGGQRQRLCIGRALIRKPELLILDDATSALDLLTDKKIRTTLAGYSDMTKVIVSQRVATIQNADYILVLDGGKVVGLGKHKDLLKNCPIYQEIYQTQIRKEEDDR